MENNKNNKFYCEKCYYLACDKYNYTRHLNSNKHKIITIQNNTINDNDELKYCICKCGKKYKHQTNLIRHNKTNCKLNKEIINEIIEKGDETIYKEIIIALMNENKNLKKNINKPIENN